MSWIVESWSLWVLLLSAFVIGWGAETAQTFLSRALALSILAWLQTAPEFAVEATIAWNQQLDLMIANLTGSLRLLVGLGWPMIFAVYFVSYSIRDKRMVKKIRLEGPDSLGVLFLFLSILYFLVIVWKRSLTVYDSAVLTVIYFVYLVLSARMPVGDDDGHDEDLPWIGKKIVKLPYMGKVMATFSLFAIGGIALYYSAHPFLNTLQAWSVTLGISTFVFVQWIAPFLSEFPEKVTAFNWARQPGKAPLAVMNMVNSNVNQWTMLAAMIPIVYSFSLGRVAGIPFDHMHTMELALTIAQSFLGGLLLLDLEFSWRDALGIFLLFLVQFIEASLREEVMVVYIAWSAFEIAKFAYRYIVAREVPRAFVELRKLRFGKQANVASPRQ